MKKALIAMSGGVDSSVAALLTLRSGCAGVGCTMRLFDSADTGESAVKSCCSQEDWQDARDVAWRLGMPHYVLDFSREFRAYVMEPFARCYRRGLTPNPCIECNRHLKFFALLNRALELGCDGVVTGHYARVCFENGRWQLKKALDESKDQSYVLYMLTQEQLELIRFPLGELTKARVREIALANGFVNAAKPDSQDICFVPDGDYAAAVRRISGTESVPGDFVDRAGSVLGRHLGVDHYTVGQRRGLGVAFGEPRYVTEIRPEDDTVVLGTNEDLFTREVYVPSFHWIAGEAPTGSVRCQAKIRYRHPAEEAEAFPLPDGGVRLVFDSPQRAVTPGQSAVVYDGDVVLGGGEIGRS